MGLSGKAVVSGFCGGYESRDSTRLRLLPPPGAAREAEPPCFSVTCFYTYGDKLRTGNVPDSAKVRPLMKNAFVSGGPRRAERTGL